MGYRSIISLMPKTPPVDADAQAFLTAAAITDPTISAAINTLVVQMKADNIWSKMKAVYPMVGGTANSHKFNLKDPRDLDAAFRLQFFGGITHNSLGVDPNGTNGYADTFFSTSANLNDNSTHLSMYTNENTTVSNGEFDMGAANSSNYLGLSARRANNNFTFGSSNSGANDFNIVSSTDSRGMSTGSFLSGALKLFKNGAVITPSYTSFGSTLPFNSIVLFAIKIDATVQSFANKRMCFASIGDGLTDTEAANLYTRVQAFQTALSRQV